VVCPCLFCRLTNRGNYCFFGRWSLNEWIAEFVSRLLLAGTLIMSQIISFLPFKAGGVASLFTVSKSVLHLTSSALPCQSHAAWLEGSVRYRRPVRVRAPSACVFDFSLIGAVSCFAFFPYSDLLFVC
jgi:hypothetical protein